MNMPYKVSLSSSLLRASKTLLYSYANLLDVKMASIDEQLKKNHVDLPKITSEYIKEKSLFSPLL